MALRPLKRFGARLLSVFLLAGCARDAASPVEPSGSIPSNPSAALLGDLPVGAVTRVTPLANDIAVSAVIGSAGGTIAIPDAGLTLVVPAGAVAKNTMFTATALAGRLVAYEFEPHGTRFPVPLQFTQDLKKAGLLGVLTATHMDGAYFADKSRLSQNGGFALVSELLRTTTDLGRTRISFPISHFSGYLVSWH